MRALENTGRKAWTFSAVGEPTPVGALGRWGVEQALTLEQPVQA